MYICILNLFRKMKWDEIMLHLFNKNKCELVDDKCLHESYLKSIYEGFKGISILPSLIIFIIHAYCTIVPKLYVYNKYINND